jgi:LacI family transcriptional regulator
VSARLKTTRPITRDEVARLAGVSSATVSYVINDGPRRVSPETRARVLQIVDQLGYKPNAVARNLRRQRTSTLGLIIPDIFNAYFAEVARGVEAMAFEQGYIVVLCHSEYSPAKEIRYLEVLGAERAAGVIWVPASDHPETLQRFRDTHIPLVILDRSVDGENIFSVIADNFRGGYLAGQHLLDLGHRRIGCIVRPVEMEHSHERMRGYQAALAEHGLTPDPDLVVPGGYRFEDGHRAASRLLDAQQPPTAVFAYNDIMAIGALRAAKDRGLAVPGDLSVVGYDDIPGAAYTDPPLTTIAQPKLAMGRRAAQLLIDSVNGQASPGEAAVRMQVALQQRQSTAPPRPIGAPR